MFHYYIYKYHIPMTTHSYFCILAPKYQWLCHTNLSIQKKSPRSNGARVSRMGNGRTGCSCDQSDLGVSLGPATTIWFSWLLSQVALADGPENPFCERNHSHCKRGPKTCVLTRDYEQSSGNPEFSCNRFK